METYNLVLDEETKGVFAVSLVENPAVEYNFLCFSKETINFSIVSVDQKEVFGVIMLADTPLPRNANPKLGIGNHNVIFSKQSIKEIVLKYSKEKLGDQVTLSHHMKTNGIYLFESWIIDRELGITPPTAFKDIPDGSWVGKFKVENDDVWSKIKSGEFKGFSIEGQFKYDNQNESLDFLKDVHSILRKIK